MGNKKRSVLNQIFSESKEEIKENLVEESGAKLLAPEIEPVIPMEKSESVHEAKIIIGDNEVAMKSTKNVEEQKIVFGNKPIEINLSSEEEPTTRTIGSLSKKELRWFQRTGMMPK